MISVFIWTVADRGGAGIAAGFIIILALIRFAHAVAVALHILISLSAARAVKAVGVFIK